MICDCDLAFVVEERIILFYCSQSYVSVTLPTQVAASRMIRAISIARVTPAIIFPLLEERSKYDKDYRLIQPQEDKTGFDRLKRMYTKNEYDEVSVELHSVVQATLTGSFIGACMGGFVQSREAYLYFIENNQATIFKSTVQAKKKLQDYVTVAFAKGAVHWGWRLGFFSGLFGFLSTSIQVYRGKTSIVEYTIAGMVTGAIYKANLGLAAACVGAGLGGALSTVAGLSILLVLKITGLSLDDIRAALRKIKEAREYHYDQAKEKSANIKNDELTKHHDLIVEQKGEKKIEEV